MSVIEKKRKMFEIQKVETAVMEMELKIEERLEDIERLKKAIKAQEAHGKKLREQLDKIIRGVVEDPKKSDKS